MVREFKIEYRWRMQVRQATLEDIAVISELVRVLDDEKWKSENPSRPEKIKGQIAKGQYYVAVRGKEIAGVMALSYGSGSCEIYSLASKEKRKGVGRALIDFAIKKCKKEGVPKLWCWSLERYHVKGFYQKMGFDEAVLLKKQWYGEDCWFFGKTVG